MKIGPLQNFWGSKHPFFEQKFRLRHLLTASVRKWGGILGKLNI